MRQYLWMVVVMVVALVVGGTTPGQAAQKKAKKRPVAAQKKQLPPPATTPGKGPLIRVGGKGSNVIVDMKPGGLYLAPCVLGTERGILPTWVPQPMNRKSYQLSCVSSVDKVSRLSFFVRCSGRAIENESAGYPLDKEFIVRFSCH